MQDNKKQKSAGGRINIRYISAERAEKIAKREQEREHEKRLRAEQRELKRVLRKQDKESKADLDSSESSFEAPEKIKMRPARDTVKRARPDSAAGISEHESRTAVNDFQVFFSGRRKWPLKLVAVLLALVAVVFSVNMLLPMGIIEHTQIALTGLGGGDGFPVSVSSSTGKHIETVGSDIALLTDSSLLLYKKNGRLIFNRQHGYASPAICASSTRMLVYDRDGKRLRLDNRYETVSSLETDAPIITCAIAKNGDFAVATRPDDAMCRVTVYNKNCEQLYIHSFSDRRVASVSLSNNGKLLCVGAYKAQNGKFVSDLLVFETHSSSQSAIREKSYADSLILSVCYKGDGVVGVFDNRAVYLDDDNKPTEYAYRSAELSYFDNYNSESTSLVLNRYNNASNSVLIIFDEDFAATDEIQLEREALGLGSNGNRVDVLTRGTLLSYNTLGEKLSETEAPSDATRVTCTSTQAALLTPTRLTTVQTD